MITLIHVYQLNSARPSFCVSICHLRWQIDVFRKIVERHSHDWKSMAVLGVKSHSSPARERSVWGWDTSSWGISSVDFHAESEFAISFNVGTSMTAIDVEIRAKNSWKSYVFSISNFLHGKVLPQKKCQRSSIEETLGYRTVLTLLCANSDLKSYEVNTQSLKIRFRRLWLVWKGTNQVGFDFFLTFSVLLFDSDNNSSIQMTSEWLIAFRLRYDAFLLENLHFQWFCDFFFTGHDK